MNRVHTLVREQRLPGRPEEVFAFFAAAENLEAITPPWLGFRIVTPVPIDMREGTLIEYRLRLHGVPLRWLTRIEVWEPAPPAPRFVDRQVRGPYALWHHAHEFEPAGDGDTLMRDTVNYALPLGWLGEAAHRGLVRRDLAAIFDHRFTAVRALIAPPASRRGGTGPESPPPPHAGRS